jgi:hypothetical protein
VVPVVPVASEGSGSSAGSVCEEGMGSLAASGQRGAGRFCEGSSFGPCPDLGFGVGEGGAGFSGPVERAGSGTNARGCVCTIFLANL